MTQNNTPNIFNRSKIIKQRKRAAENFNKHDFLFRQMAENLCERLEYIKRKFPVALDLGAKTGIIEKILRNRGGIEYLVQMEICEDLLSQAGGVKIIGDEENIPFADNSFDLVISSGSLHSVNDLVGTLIQVRKILKPSGLFLAAFFGGETLSEMRSSFEKAEIECKGGISPRILPFINIQTAGSLLQRAGFVLPVVDSDFVNVSYEHPLKLMRELRGMGEANCLNDSIKNFTPCSLVMSAVYNYFQDFSDDEGRINAGFEIITVTGWKAES